MDAFTRKLMREIQRQIEELATELPTLHYQTYAQHPTEEEVASLRTGSDEERIAAVIRLNDKYRDGWSPSASIAGLAHNIHVTALPLAPPAANSPSPTDLSRLTECGLTHAQAVYALGGVSR